MGGSPILGGLSLALRDNIIFLHPWLPLPEGFGVMLGDWSPPMAFGVPGWDLRSPMGLGSLGFGEQTGLGGINPGEKGVLGCWGAGPPSWGVSGSCWGVPAVGWGCVLGGSPILGGLSLAVLEDIAVPCPWFCCCLKGLGCCWGAGAPS